MTNITSVALAVAVIGMAAPRASAQQRVYNGATGRYTYNNTNSGMYNSTIGMANNGGYNLLNAYNSGYTLGMYNNSGYNLLNSYNNGYNLGMYNNSGYNLMNNYGSTGSYNGYVPYNAYSDNGYGTIPYRYNNPGGALVMGSDGQLYNPSLGNDAVEPTVDADGVTIPQPVVPVPTVRTAPARTSDQIDAVRLSGNRIRIEWTGDPRPVETMTFSLLDRNRTALKLAILNGLPARTTFTVPSNAAFYRVVITYTDGATRSIVTPL